MLIRTSLLAATLLVGCGPYVRVQQDLIEQARHGVDQLDRSLAQKRAIVHAYHALVRERLEDASDADIRGRESLSPDWVIEHRRAYSAALDALSEARHASERAEHADRRNLDAVHAALDRLKWLSGLWSRESIRSGERR